MSIFDIPRGVDSALWMNKYQKRVTNAPVTRPAIAPVLVARFQYRAEVYMGRKDAAHRPKNMAVPLAMIFPGSIYPKTTEINTANIMPILVIMTELFPFLPV